MISGKVFAEYEKNGFKINSFTTDDLIASFEAFISIGASEDTANKLLILAIRDAANQGGKSFKSIQKTVETWIAFDMTTVDQVADFVNKRDAGEEIKKPTWTTGKIPVPSEEEKAKAKEYLAEMIEQVIANPKDE